MKNKLFLWEFLGAIFIVITGSLMHFAFDWSNKNPLSAIFFAVNESTWEHLKLAFWPTFMLFIIQLIFLRPRGATFWTAKAASLLLPSLLIPIFFYTYVALLGFDFLILDIIIFVIAVAIGQFVSYMILTIDSLPKSTVIVSIIIIVSLTVVFSLLTYFPPDNALFLDPKGGYGLNAN